MSIIKEDDPVQKFFGNYRAQVINATDPDKLGKIQARVYPMLKDVISADLPWAVPASPIWDGAGDNIGQLNIPSVNSWVYVFFEAGDIYQPVYFAEAQTKTKGLPTIAQTNYPHRKVKRTTAGIEIYIDDVTKMASIKLPSGVLVTVDDLDKKIHAAFPLGATLDILDSLLKFSGNVQVGSGATGILMGSAGSTGIFRSGILTDLL